MDVFISYSRDDDTLTSDVCHVLEERGHTAWRDTANIPGGADWRAAIEKAIPKSDAFVILLSPAVVLNPGHVREELHYARSHDKLIVPVYLKRVKQLPDGYDLILNGKNRINLYPSFGQGMERLVAVIGEGDPAVPEQLPALRSVVKARFHRMQTKAHKLAVEARQRELGRKTMLAGGALLAAGAAIATAGRQGAAGEKAKAEDLARRRYRQKVEGVVNALGGVVGELDGAPLGDYMVDLRPKLHELLGGLNMIEPPTADLQRSHFDLVERFRECLDSIDNLVEKVSGGGSEEASQRAMRRMVHDFSEFAQAYSTALGSAS